MNAKLYMYHRWSDNVQQLNDLYQNKQFNPIDVSIYYHIVDQFMQHEKLNSISFENGEKTVTNNICFNEISKTVDFVDTEDYSIYDSVIDEIISQQKRIIDESKQYLNDISIVYKFRMNILDSIDEKTNKKQFVAFLCFGIIGKRK